MSNYLPPIRVQPLPMYTHGALNKVFVPVTIFLKTLESVHKPLDTNLCWQKKTQESQGFPCLHNAKGPYSGEEGGEVKESTPRIQQADAVSKQG